MLPRVARTALIISCFGFGVVGVVACSVDALIFWGSLGLLVGVCGWLVAEDLPSIRAHVGKGLSDVRWGALVGGAVLAGYVTIVGLATVLGTVAAAAVVVVAVAFWAYRRFVPRRTTTASPEPRTAPEPPAPDTRPGVAALSDDDLCLAWRRSYFELQRAGDERTRYSVVMRRQEYLDELDRRNRKGFVRWLDSGARAGGDPHRYLAADG
ncbi:hypothetical protein [Amycolatopsis sp. CA-230715]|uniref:hypothetical protein n=1 Tax=Amycolatopsis sp. CA-230715 TaxID=2745196 RepID=UPI001C02BBC4|nr:hypothetical protein [Amycolatopsis sp. CA-230715]QWF85930.1 hypothetical protein HUW46_09411 [Amycolatopsis sp. CA-230715]